MENVWCCFHAMGVCGTAFVVQVQCSGGGCERKVKLPSRECPACNTKRRRKEKEGDHAVEEQSRRSSDNQAELSDSNAEQQSLCAAEQMLQADAAVAMSVQLSLPMQLRSAQAERVSEYTAKRRALEVQYSMSALNAVLSVQHMAAVAQLEVKRRKLEEVMKKNEGIAIEMEEKERETIALKEKRDSV